MTDSILLYLSTPRASAGYGPEAYRDSIEWGCDAIEKAAANGVDVDDEIRTLVEICNHTPGDGDTLVSTAVSRRLTWHFIEMRDRRPDIATHLERA